MAAPAKQLVRAAAVRHVLAGLTRLGHSQRTLIEAQRDIKWWLDARTDAGATRSPRLLKGWALNWSPNGYVELVEMEVPRAGRDRVTILVHASSVSAGTERAQYLKLPNVAVGVGAKLGYSLAGVVVATGAGVSDFEVGDEVAVTDAPHASLATVPPSQVFAVPGGVSLPAASLVKIGAISGQGVELSRLQPGEAFGVVGGGIIGALAMRIAAGEGAVPEAVIATSRHKESLARTGGARSFLTTAEDAEAIAALELPVVIEATGSPAAIGVAVTAAAPGGRVVLLGSSRGVTGAFPMAEIRAKGLELVGAHVDTLNLEATRIGGDPKRRQAKRFLRLLAEGSLNVDDLVGPAIDPRDAPRFFRRLAQDQNIVGAHFDWTRLAPAERSRRGSLLRLPDPSGRGMDLDKLPLPPNGRRRARSRGLLELPDPFEGATGDLRIGMLGCGDISLQNAAGVADAPNARLVACFDPDTALAEDLAAQHGAVVVPTAEALVGLPEVDAAFIAVPHHLHAPLAEMAIAAGRHVIVEKPPANDLAGALAMTEAAERAGVRLSVCFPQRYDPTVVIARRLIEAGALGEFGGSAVRVYMDKSPAYWLGGFSGRSHSTWRSSRAKAGGGVLIMNVSHYLDVVRHLAGVDVDWVSSVASTVDDDVEVEDSISVSMAYANGAVGTTIGSSAVRGTTSSELGLWGRDGHVVLEPRPRVYSLRPVDGLRTARWQTFGRLPGVNIRAVYVSRLATAIHRDLTPDVSEHDAVAVQALMEAMYKSSDEQRAVRPASLLPEARR